MQYFGGKAQIRNWIASLLGTGDRYVEPFVGGCWVLAATHRRFRYRYASDLNPAVIAMWKALQAGWCPPECVSEEDYQRARGLDDADPLKAFIGIGCAWGGKWFRGYARGRNGRNYALNAKRSLLTKLPSIFDVSFQCADYRDVPYPSGATVYCDPPYNGTEEYRIARGFNWPEFWDFYAGLSMDGKRVFVSEYSAPPGWVEVGQHAVTTSVRSPTRGRCKRVERLFVYNLAVGLPTSQTSTRTKP